MKQWEALLFWGGVLKLIAREAVKRKGRPQNHMQCLFVLGGFRGWRKVKRVIWKGVTFNFPQVQQDASYSMKEEGNICLLYYSIMVMSVYYCQSGMLIEGEFRGEEWRPFSLWIQNILGWTMQCIALAIWQDCA